MILVSVEELAAFLALKPDTLRRWVYARTYPALKAGKTIRFDLDTVLPMFGMTESQVEAAKTTIRSQRENAA